MTAKNLATMQVVFLHGPAASGKHTVGVIVAERLGWPLFHNHLTVDLVATLFDFGSQGFRALRAEIWRRSFAEAARAGLSFVFTFHPEATVERSLIDELVGIVEAEQGEVRFVELRCPEDVVLERLDAPSRARFGKLQDKDLYRSIAEAGGFDFPALPAPVLVVDTASVEPDEAARRIVAAISGAAR